MSFSNHKLLILISLLMLSSSSVFSQIVLQKGDHECRSPSLKDQPLLDAVRASDYVSVKRLLQQGANANAKDDCGVSAVTYASAILHPGILKELIDAGAKVDVIDRFNYMPPLLWAISSQDIEDEERIVEIIRLLVQAGVDVNVEGEFNHPGLVMATRARLNSVAELLIESGANVNAKDGDGRTAYSYASQLGNSRLKNLLIAAGADTTIGVREYERDFGTNAFIQAASDGRTDIIEAMLADGIDVDFVNEAGVTALMRIVEDSTLDALLAAGADVNRSDNAGFTALVWASYFGRVSQVKKLIAAGADVNATTHDGNTSLKMAKAEVKEILIAAGARN